MGEMRELLKKLFINTGIITTLLPLLVLGQHLVINEVVSSNHASLDDEDGDSPDWVELYNPGNTLINLYGYGVSDDRDEPFKFTFLQGSVAPLGHLVFFASDKDRQGIALNWNPVITAGDDWTYFVGTSEPASNWNTLSFADGSWSTGPTGIGYGDDDDATVINSTLSLYMRKSFFVEDLATVLALMFHMDVDDGYIAYLNGVEIGRQNMGSPGSFKSYQATSDNYTEPLLPQNIDLTPLMLDHALLNQGSNVLAIQVHNHGTQSSDMTALPFLTIGQLEATGETLPDYLIVPGEQQIHTNFKLSSSGETVYLTNPDANLVDSLMFPPLRGDMSYGFSSDGVEPYQFFMDPTPGMANSGGFTHLATPPVPTLQPGFYTGTQAVAIPVAADGTVYRYTLNGSKPDGNSTRYVNPFTISNTSVLKIRSSSSDGHHHVYSTFSYFIDSPHEMAVMSLTFEPEDFFDNDSGIYVMGDNASGSFPHFGANFWEDWERPVNIEYFEDAQTLSFSSPAGVKVFGGWSRGHAQRSLSLFARGRYGASEFEYPFFEERDYDKFQSLVLRNSGNDWPETGYRDVFMSSLVADRDIDRQAYQPVEVYLNGDYWGIYNLREKISEHFVASLADIDKDDLDLLEIEGSIVHGSNDQYMDLINFVETHSLSSDADFEYIRERVDLDNFIEYQFAQIYFDNQDWPGNNIKYWKSHEPGGRWRWILYDTDFGFGTWGPGNYQRNTLAFATNPSGPTWPNPPWSTLLLRKFLNNVAFKNEFILKASDMLNSNFRPEQVTQKLMNARDAISTGVLDNFDRWGHNSVSHWTNQYGVMDNFGQQRPAHVRIHMRNKFGLPAEQPLTVQVEPENAGVVRVHSLVPRDLPWTGYYFANVPLDIEALAASGYQFSHWAPLPYTDAEISINMSSSVNLTAVFEELPGSVAGIIINEINYHSEDSSDCKDWLELYNTSPVELNLNGWYLSDSNDDNLFYLGNTSIASNGYLVLSSDSLAFRQVHGSTPRLVGDVDFNFSNDGELIRLYDPLGMLVDSLTYNDVAPWPPAADGSGATLELIHPSLDNGLSENWAASTGLGTPGAQNSRFNVPDNIEETQLPETLAIHTAYPNPFNAQVSVSLSLAYPEAFRVQVYNLRGALIRDTQVSDISGSQYTYTWDGMTHSGNECSSGMYIVRLTQRTKSSSIKIALLR